MTAKGDDIKKGGGCEYVISKLSYHDFLREVSYSDYLEEVSEEQLHEPELLLMRLSNLGDLDERVRVVDEDAHVGHLHRLARAAVRDGRLRERGAEEVLAAGGGIAGIL